jgi:hypothetical protein
MVREVRLPSAFSETAVAALVALVGPLGAGCPAPGPFGEANEPPEPLEVPAIASFSATCDVDAAMWTVTAELTSWSGGAVTDWSGDLVYIERHAVLAVASAPDGTGETLLLELPIVGDWRMQAANQSTIFTCADAPSIAFALLALGGGVVECRTIGELGDALAASPTLGCPAP